MPLHALAALSSYAWQAHGQGSSQQKCEAPRAKQDSKHAGPQHAAVGAAIPQDECVTLNEPVPSTVITTIPFLTVIPSGNAKFCG